MKLFRLITGLIILLIVSSVQATTLKLSTDINLLVLNGHKISGSLLKGAEGLELERGEHQLLFRVEKEIKSANGSVKHWISAPQIVTFTTRSPTVAIKLPALTTLREVREFEKHPQFILLGANGQEITSRRDRLKLPADSNFEKAMLHYNMTGKAASVPRFALQNSSPLSQDISLNRSPAERMLHLWYQQVDAATRQRFIILLKALHTS